MIPNAEDTLIITDSLAMDAIADAYPPVRLLCWPCRRAVMYF